MFISGRNYLKVNYFFMIFAMMFFSKTLHAEDFNPALEGGFKNPIKYIGKYGEVLSVEKIDEKKLHFNILVNIGYRVCDLSGIANLNSKKNQDYEFAHEDCNFHLKISGDNQTITPSDNQNKCALRVCDRSNAFNGSVFNQVK